MQRGERSDMGFFKGLRAIPILLMDGFDSLALEANGEVPSRFNAVLDADIREPPRDVSSLETMGSLTASPDEFSARVDVDYIVSAPETGYESHLFHVDGSGDGYVVEAEQRYTILPHEKSDWRSRERAALVIERMFEAISPYFEGVLDVEMESHSVLDENPYTSDKSSLLDIEYRVSLGELQSGFTEGVLGASMDAPRVDELRYSYERKDRETSSTLNASIRNHHAVIVPVLEGGGFNDAEEIYHAKSETGFSSRLYWWGEYSKPKLSLGAQFGADNAERYIEELEMRGLPVPPMAELSLDAKVLSDSVDVSFDFSGGEISGSARSLLDFDRWYGVVPSPLVALWSFMY